MSPQGDRAVPHNFSMERQTRSEAWSPVGNVARPLRAVCFEATSARHRVSGGCGESVAL
uniref:Uncharacterized protein n=1 Tax=Arundo donax TaxID=35708 RepID=A0A0A8YGI9_ARUDO